jgi:hypothetical protein
MDHPDCRANGRIFATIAPDHKWAMVKLTPEQQNRYIGADPSTFVPASGAWGRQGCTMVRLASVDEATLRDAMRLAWQNTVKARGGRPAGEIRRLRKPHAKTSR